MTSGISTISCRQILREETTPDGRIIRSVLNEIKCECQDWIQLAPKMIQWQAAVSAVMDFLDSTEGGAFSRRTLLHAIGLWVYKIMTLSLKRHKYCTTIGPTYPPLSIYSN
jgi:hypothetical protein